MKSHDNKNMNHCALCGRKFIFRNDLNIHIKRNTEKNYIPVLCGQGIISGNHTKRHMKSLARENLYQSVLHGNKKK
jgi:hypothetical protein